MSDRNIVLASLQAFFTNPSDTHAQALRPHLADDLTVSVHTTNETSADSAITALQQSLFHHVVHGGQWEEPQIDGDTVTQVLAMPAKGIAAGCRFRLTFNERAKLGRIEGEWMLPPAQLTPEPVLLTAAMRARLNDAEKDKMPVLFAYVTPAGRPEQIYGSGTHVHGDDQLAFWNPRADGSFVKSIAVNPRVSGIYRHDETHEMLEIAGRARGRGRRRGAADSRARAGRDCRFSRTWRGRDHRPRQGDGLDPRRGNSRDRTDPDGS